MRPCGGDSVAWGAVSAGRELALGPYVVLGGALAPVSVGEDVFLGAEVSIQGGPCGSPAVVGDSASLARQCVVEGATVGEGSVLEERVVVLEGAALGAGALIEAGSVVESGQTLAGAWLHRGSPAQPVRPLERGELARAHGALRRAIHANRLPDMAGAGDDPLLSGRALALAEAEVDAALAALGLTAQPGRTFLAPRNWKPGALVMDEHLCEGSIELADAATVWFACRLDGGAHGIRMGKGTTLGDNVVLYALSAPSALGDGVVIDAGCALHDCHIGDEVWIGASSFISAGTHIESRSRLLPGTATRPGQHIKAGVWGGRPAQRMRDLRPEDLEHYQARLERESRKREAWLTRALLPPGSPGQIGA